jgi:hypothetical protein
MASVVGDIRTLVFAILVLAVFVGGAYLINPGYVGRMLGLREGFSSMGVPTMGQDANYKMNAASMDVSGAVQQAAATANPNVATGATGAAGTMGATTEGFGDLSDMEGPAGFGNAEQPAGCYPRDQLTPSELLPKDPNSVWAQQNPMGTGSLKGKNFLSAGALIGVNTVGQSLRNANYQLRSEPPNPQVPVSVWSQSTIEPDVNRRTLEVA